MPRDGAASITLADRPLLPAETLARVIDHVTDAVMVTDANLDAPGPTVLYVNKAFERMTGFPAGEMVGNSPRLLQGRLTDRAQFATMRSRLANGMAWRGEAVNYRRDGGAFVMAWEIVPILDETGRPSAFVATQRDATEAHARARRDRFAMLHDPITDALSIVGFRESFARLRDRTEGGPLDVAFVGIAGVESQLPLLSLADGAAMAREIKNRIRHALGDGMPIARLDAGRYAAAWPADPVALQLLQTIMAEPYLINGLPQHIACHVGVASWPEDGNDADELISAARLASYVGMQTGQDLVVFRRDTRAAMQRRRAIEQGLRRAAQQGELSLAWQPKLSLPERRLCGLEALLRWHSAELGAVGPDEFIPIAETTGSIVPIGIWVARTMVAALGQAWAAGTRVPASFNLSRAQLGSTEATDRLLAALLEAMQDAHLPPDAIEIEITESIDDTEETRAAIRRFAASGMRIVIDDFGQRFSSFGTLADLPASTVKLDRAITQRAGSGELCSLAVVEGLVSVARRLELTVVAEGIETEAEAEALGRLGCTVGQGYLFARPMPLAQALAVGA